MRIPAPIPTKQLEVQPTDPKVILDAIAKEAQGLWGRNWFAYLVRRYCEIEEAVTGQKVEARKRRSTIERALETGDATLKTVTWLAASVGAELQMTIHRVEIRKL